MTVDVLMGAGPPLWQSWLVVAHEGHLNDSAPTGRRDASADSPTPPFALDLQEWMGRKGHGGETEGREDEDPLNSWQQMAEILTPCAEAFVIVGSGIPYPQNFTAWHENGVRSLGFY